MTQAIIPPERLAKLSRAERERLTSFLDKATRAIGRTCSINMGTAIRTGRVVSVEFAGFNYSPSGKTQYALWKIGQEVPKLDGTGFVTRHATVRELPQ